MTSFETSIAIHAPRERAWQLLADVASWPAVLPTMASVKALDRPELAPGARFRVRQPWLPPTNYVVTQVEPGRQFAWMARSPGLRMVAQHTVEAAAEGECSLSLCFSFEGWLAPLMARLYGRLTQRYLALEAEAIKMQAEAR